MCVRQAAGKKVSVLLPEYALRVNTMQQNLDAQLALIRQREQEIQTLQTDYRVTYALGWLALGKIFVCKIFLLLACLSK